MKKQKPKICHLFHKLSLSLSSQNFCPTDTHQVYQLDFLQEHALPRKALCLPSWLWHYNLWIMVCHAQWTLPLVLLTEGKAMTPLKNGSQRKVTCLGLLVSWVNAFKNISHFMGTPLSLYPMSSSFTVTSVEWMIELIFWLLASKQWGLTSLLIRNI